MKVRGQETESMKTSKLMESWADDCAPHESRTSSASRQARGSVKMGEVGEGYLRGT